MNKFAPCLLAAGLAVAATAATARVVVTDGNDDQRVTEGVSGPIQAARPSRTKTDADSKSGRAVEMSGRTRKDSDRDNDRDKTDKAQHSPPPPVHDPN